MIVQRVVYPRCGTTEEGLYVYTVHPGAFVPPDERRKETKWERADRERDPRPPKSVIVKPLPLGVALIGEEERIEAGAYRGRICFETYFNTLSVKKWKKYTSVDKMALRIGIKGRARVCLTIFNLFRNRAEEHVAASFLVDHEQMREASFDYPLRGDEEALSFYIQPLSDGVVIQGGAYTTNVEESSLPQVRLALAVCTYRREEYVERNMDLVKREVFDCPDSPLYGHVRAYVVDNGHTLDAGRFDGRFIRVIPNKNSGGSGGFSRGAIEALADRDFAPTHVLLMDDDITFETSALEKTYNFLRLLKEEYRVCLLGGAMFLEDSRFLQCAAGEVNTLKGFVFNRIGYNMYDMVDVLRNEREERINYLAWWFCCVPAEIFRRVGFSLPLFVQYDDIEFCMRNDVPKIALNGICCWHVAFDRKWSGPKRYYNIRNRAIVDALYFDGFGKRIFKLRLLKECLKRTFQFSYKEAHLALMAAEDFLKGLKWLSEQDPSELNQRLYALSDKLVDEKELSVVCDLRELKRTADMDLRALPRWTRWLTLNGWVLPAKNRMAMVEATDPPMQFLFRAKSALKYDELTGKAMLAHKSYREAFAVMKRMLRLCFEIDRKFDGAVKEYRELAPQARSEAFWRKFLGF